MVSRSPPQEDVLEIPLPSDLVGHETLDNFREWGISRTSRRPVSAAPSNDFQEMELALLSQRIYFHSQSRVQEDSLQDASYADVLYQALSPQPATITRAYIGGESSAESRTIDFGLQIEIQYADPSAVGKVYEGVAYTHMDQVQGLMRDLKATRLEELIEKPVTAYLRERVLEGISARKIA